MCDKPLTELGSLSSKCILSKGEWYKFNDDYLQYLHDSIEEIPVIYDPKYDFNTGIHNTFIEQLYLADKDNPYIQGLNREEALKKLKKKYYAERVFNILRENDGFDNYDRICYTIDNTKFEAMDLYKNGAMHAVKIGSSSSKLCYAVDQSLSTLKALKNSDIRKELPEIDTVVIWLVLETTKKPEDIKDIFSLNDLNMLMLKNRLDQWKCETLIK